MLLPPLIQARVLLWPRQDSVQRGLLLLLLLLWLKRTRGNQGLLWL